MSNIWLLDVWTNGVDYVIATHRRQARSITADFYGYNEPLTQVERIAVEGDGQWRIIPSNEEFSMQFDDDEEITKTALSWAFDWGEPVYLACHVTR